MKFRNGHWLYKEVTACFSPKMVYEIHREEDALIIYAPAAAVKDRGDTLGGIVLTLRITTPVPEVIRVQVWHHMGTARNMPRFELNLPETLRQKGIFLPGHGMYRLNGWKAPRVRKNRKRRKHRIRWRSFT